MRSCGVSYLIWVRPLFKSKVVTIFFIKSNVRNTCVRRSELPSDISTMVEKLTFKNVSDDDICVVDSHSVMLGTGLMLAMDWR